VDLEDGSYCTECGILYTNKNWKLNASEEYKKKPIICPACKKIKEDYYLGILELKGDFLKSIKKK